MTPPATNSAPHTATRKKIFLVEDHPITLEGLSQIINYQTDLTVCGSTATAAEALRKIPALLPNLVITDLTLANGSGLDLIKDLAIQHPRLPVLVLSMHDEKIYAERALRAGARGYAMKNEPGATLLARIRTVLEGGIAVSENIRRAFIGRAVGGDTLTTDPVTRLTDREIQVFRLLGEGRTTSEIASTLGLGISTIETHRARIKEKLGLASATDLIAAAVRWTSSGT